MNEQLNTINSIIISLLLLIGIYHLYLYIARYTRKEEKYNLFISLTYFIAALYVFHAYFLALNRIFGKFTGTIYISILTLLTYTSTKVIIHILKINKRFKKFFFIPFLIFFVALLLTSTELIFGEKWYFKFIYKKAILLCITAFFALILICLIWILKNKDLSKKSNIWILFVGYTFMLLGGGMEKVIPPLINNHMILLISILFFTFSLAIKINNEFWELIDLKDTLEQKVHNRTKDLQKAKNQIEQKEKQKTIAFTNIFHEIKTPLTLISNYVEKHIKNYGTSEEIKIARDNIDKLKRDILNALDFEKLDRGMVFYDHSKITDLSDIVTLNIFMYKELANRKKIIIKNNIQDHIYTKIDKNSIDRVINNLIDNAVKYTPSNGEINIILKADNKDIELIISDTGIGISKEEQKNIFKPYYQISHNKRNIQGIGMGLNIVKKIITEVKGEIKVESEKDKGTTFIIKLKRYHLREVGKVDFISKDKKPAVDITDIKLKELEYKEDKPNVFVVEDNIQMLSYLQDSLYNDYNFFHASNGKEALEKIDKIKKPDIIISDIMMDEMDGYKFYDELKNKSEKYKSIPLIYLTAKTMENEKIKGLKKGAVDYIYKPFSMDELSTKIESIIKNEKIKRENDIIERNNNVRNKLYIEYGISKREIEVLNLLFKGCMRKEIAYELNITMSTVRTYLNRIFTKCNVKSKKELLKVFNIKS